MHAFRVFSIKKYQKVPNQIDGRKTLPYTPHPGIYVRTVDDKNDKKECDISKLSEIDYLHKMSIKHVYGYCRENIEK